MNKKYENNDFQNINSNTSELTHKQNQSLDEIDQIALLRQFIKEPQGKMLRVWDRRLRIVSSWEAEPWDITLKDFAFEMSLNFSNSELEGAIISNSISDERLQKIIDWLSWRSKMNRWSIGCL